MILVSGESSGTIKGIIGMTFNREKGELELQLGTERRGKRRMKRLAFNDIMCARTRIFLNPFISEDEQQQEKEQDQGSPAAQSCLLHRQPVASCTPHVRHTPPTQQTQLTQIGTVQVFELASLAHVTVDTSAAHVTARQQKQRDTAAELTRNCTGWTRRSGPRNTSLRSDSTTLHRLRDTRTSGM